MSAGPRVIEWSEPGGRDMDGQAGEGSRVARGQRANQWTRDGKLRQPVFLGLREDKNPREVTRE